MYIEELIAAGWYSETKNSNIIARKFWFPYYLNTIEIVHSPKMFPGFQSGYQTIEEFIPENHLQLEFNAG